MYNEELYHYGVKGMKWGHRRAIYRQAKSVARQRRNAAYQEAALRSDKRTNKNFDSNPGAQKSGFIKGKANRAAYRQAEKSNIDRLTKDYAKADAQYKSDIKKAKQEYKDSKPQLSDKQKTAIAVGVTAMGTALAAYGAHKFSKYIREENTKIHVEEGQKLAHKYIMDLNKVGYPPSFDHIGKAHAKAELAKIKEANNDSFRRAVKNVYNYRKKR